ncbi:MAG: trigger factor [Rickettsiales bacterium]|jgi:trigger factor|nr:trigger factor [Rickettsiales bacterium]
MIKKEKIKDLHYSLTGVISAADIAARADEILTEYGKTAKMAGFRKGHIPLTILRQKFGATARGEALDKMMNADMEKYVADKKLRLAAAPRADFVNYKDGADAEYTLEFDILPTLPEIDLSKITITKPVADVPESEVEKSIENLCKSRAQAEKQNEKYTAADGDVVVIDFKGFMGDKAFDGGEAKKHHLILGSGSFIPGFEEKIIGHKAGDEFDIKVRFPKEYHSADLVGKEAKFEIKIHEIRKHILPELNDELAKEVGIESVQKLREHIREILTEQYSGAAKKEMRNELLDILADKVKMDIPEVLIEQELKMAADEAVHSGAKFDEKKERKDSSKRVLLGLILAEWGTQNKVAITNEELQRAVWDEASRYPDPQQVFQFYNKNPNALTMVRGMLFEQKVLDEMLKQVKPKEKKVKPEELFKQKEVK